MKKLTFSLLAIVSLVATSFAGTEISSGKDYKDYKKQPLPTCFNDQELQLDIFGAYADGNALDHAGPLRDHGWGGGVGVNYFFHRNIGVGVDATWLYMQDNSAPGNSNDGSDTQLHHFTGSLIFRFPIDELCLAPYVFVGGGLSVDGRQWASAHGGLGVEYRVVPHKVGLFTDARFTYFGDRFGNGDQNFILVRAGVRLVF